MVSIVNRKYEKNKEGTVFRHVRNGKILCRLDASLTRDDWEQLHGLISLVFNAGLNAGSEQRASEIREALGIPVPG